VVRRPPIDACRIRTSRTLKRLLPFLMQVRTRHFPRRETRLAPSSKFSLLFRSQAQSPSPPRCIFFPFFPPPYPASLCFFRRTEEAGECSFFFSFFPPTAPSIDEDSSFFLRVTTITAIFPCSCGFWREPRQQYIPSFFFRRVRNPVRAYVTKTPFFGGPLTPLFRMSRHPFFFTHV